MEKDGVRDSSFSSLSLESAERCEQAQQVHCGGRECGGEEEVEEVEEGEEDEWAEERRVEEATGCSAAGVLRT